MRAEIEMLQNAPVGGIEQNNVVGKIVGDQQRSPLFTVTTVSPAG